jgi:hypothetical protein
MKDQVWSENSLSIYDLFSYCPLNMVCYQYHLLDTFPRYIFRIPIVFALDCRTHNKKVRISPEPVGPNL